MQKANHYNAEMAHSQRKIFGFCPAQSLACHAALLEKNQSSIKWQAICLSALIERIFMYISELIPL